MIALHFLERGKSAGKVEKRSRVNASRIVLVRGSRRHFLFELVWFFSGSDKNDFFFYICKMIYSFFLDFTQKFTLN